MVAASFPLFSRQMFQSMGIQWASTLLGCVAAVLVPIPIGFYFFGKKMRMKSKFAPFYEAVQEGHASDDADFQADAQAEETVQRQRSF